MALAVKNAWRLCGGWLKQCTHLSSATKTNMTFSIYLPPQSETMPVPMLWYLSGLTCTDENFMQKAGRAFGVAAQRGVALIAPDTSPRGTSIPGENDSYDFGSGAGFYVNATEPLWAENYRMREYVAEELPQLIKANFPVDPTRESIFGHSMGGHGALTIAMGTSDRFRSVSAFAPICNPTQCAWGQKAFTGYLGKDEKTWAPYDATMLMDSHGPYPFDILIDQGADDKFLKEGQLRPEAFRAACERKGQKLTYREDAEYDHSYFFINSFVDEHVSFHADALLKS